MQVTRHTVNLHLSNSLIHHFVKCRKTQIEPHYPKKTKKNVCTESPQSQKKLYDLHCYHFYASSEILYVYHVHNEQKCNFYCQKKIGQNMRKLNIFACISCFLLC